MKTLLSIIVILVPAFASADFVQQPYAFTFIGIQPGQMATGEHDPADTEMLYFNLKTAASTDATTWFADLAPNNAITVAAPEGFEEFAVTDIGEQFHTDTRWGSIAVTFVGGTSATLWPFAQGEGVTVLAVPEPAAFLFLLPLVLLLRGQHRLG